MAQKKRRPVQKGRAKKGGAAKGLVVIAVLLLAFGIFWNNFTKIRVIEVTGVTLTDADEIARRSGITTGMRIYDIDEEAIDRALGTLGKWEFLGMETEGYSTVRLHMRTRFERAVAHYAGSSLVLDEYGQVMENRRDDPEYSLLEVVGLEIRSAVVGQELDTTDKNQIYSVRDVIIMLDQTGAYSRVRELNAKDLDNLYLITVTGLRVEIGDAENLEKKFQWMTAVLDSLEAEGVYSGTLDVSTGESAVYKPQ